MEVKIEESPLNTRIIDVYWRNECVGSLVKSLYRKKIKDILKMEEPKKELPALEKQVAYGYCLTLLAKRDYTSYQLKKKLKDKLISEGGIEYALEKVAPYIDDDALLQRVISWEKTRGKGPLAILSKLMRKSDASPGKLKRLLEENYVESERLSQAVTLVEKRE